MSPYLRITAASALTCPPASSLAAPIGRAPASEALVFCRCTLGQFLGLGRQLARSARSGHPRAAASAMSQLSRPGAKGQRPT